MNISFSSVSEGKVEQKVRAQDSTRPRTAKRRIAVLYCSIPTEQNSKAPKVNANLPQTLLVESHTPHGFSGLMLLARDSSLVK